MSLKSAEVYKFRKNKNNFFNSSMSRRPVLIFWNSRDKGTYIRGAEGKTLLKKLINKVGNK